MKKLYTTFLFAIAAITILKAQDYQISFSITGETGTPDSVLVENITTDTSILLNGDDTLHLVNELTTIKENQLTNQKLLTIFPNPTKSNVKIFYISPYKGKTHIRLHTIDGKELLYKTYFLEKDSYEFELYNIYKGTYIISITNKNIKSTSTIVSQSELPGKPQIELNQSKKQQSNKTVTKLKKGASEIIQIQYNIGDTLNFTGYLNTFTNNINNIIPTSDQTISFSFLYPPEAGFWASNTIVAINETIHFSDTSTNNPTSWMWDFGDGNNSNEQNPTHSYTSVGTYTVTLTATNESGSNTETKLELIDVGKIPVTIFNASDTIIATTEEIFFYDLSINSPDSWTWQFGDGNTSTAQNPSHMYNSSGLYTITLTASNMYGTSTLEKEEYIKAGIIPEANFTTLDSTLEINETVLFYDLSTDNPTEWFWEFGDGNSSTEQNPTHSYSLPGYYTVNLTASNEFGINTTTKTNYINIGFAPIVDFWANDTIIFGNETINFTDNSLNTPTIWHWDFGDGTTSTQQNPNHTFPNEGIYTISLTTSNLFGEDSDTKTGYIIVKPSCDNSIIDIDGNEYNILNIGDQCWMAKNLKTIHYPNGDNVPFYNNSEFSTLPDLDTSDGAGVYEVNSNITNDHTNSSYFSAYGILYNYSAATGDNWTRDNDNQHPNQGICPNGWHLPSDDEWKVLEIELGMSVSDANELENERGTNQGSQLASHSEMWLNGELDNDPEFGSSGFSIIPAGTRYSNGAYSNETVSCGYWSSTKDSNGAYYRYFHYSTSKIRRYYFTQSYGFYIRCVRD